MNVLFLLGNLEPYSSANAECVKNITQSFSQDGITIHYLSFGNRNTISEDSFHHTVKAHRFLGNRYFRGEIKGIRRKLYLLVCNTVEPPYPRYSVVLKNNYLSMMVKLGKKYCFDRIVSVIHPVEGALATVEYKELNPRIQMIVYEVDSITDDPIFDSGWRRLYEKKSRKLEKMIYDSADLILHIDSHEKHFTSNYYERWKQKFRITGLPMISPKYYIGKTPPFHGCYEITYTGSLSHKWRSPKYIFDLLNRIKKYRFHLSFCSRGCDDYLQAIQNERPSEITLRGYVSGKEVIRQFANSHYLLSIGNEGSSILPSKVFQYISTGLPIIHLAADERDVCIPILERYANCVILNKQKSIENNISSLLNFVEKGLHTVDYYDISRLFQINTPAYTGSFLFGEQE